MTTTFELTGLESKIADFLADRAAFSFDIVSEFVSKYDANRSDVNKALTNVVDLGTVKIVRTGSKRKDTRFAYANAKNVA